MSLQTHSLLRCCYGNRQLKAQYDNWPRLPVKILKFIRSHITAQGRGSKILEQVDSRRKQRPGFLGSIKTDRLKENKRRTEEDMR